MTITIDKRDISNGDSPYVVAELSANHNKDLGTIYQSIAQAHAAGADAIKLQTFTPDDITLNCKNPDFKITKGLWKDKYLWDLYNEASLPLEWHKSIFDYAKNLGITIFTSVFHPSKIEFLENLDCPAYKIASFENNYLDLLKEVAKTNKPIIVSLGHTTLAGIQEILDTVLPINKKLILLKCTSTYPSISTDCNLMAISFLKGFCLEEYGPDIQIGFSDHTVTNVAAITSVGLGATFFEKHFTLPEIKSIDNTFSITPRAFKQYVDDLRASHRSLGNIKFSVGSEVEVKNFKRSLYVAKPIKQGEKFTVDNLREVRPGNGSSISDKQTLLGQKANRDFNIGDKPAE